MLWCFVLLPPMWFATASEERRNLHLQPSVAGANDQYTRYMLEGESRVPLSDQSCGKLPGKIWIPCPLNQV
jgi:hypothetical protein